MDALIEAIKTYIPLLSIGFNVIVLAKYILDAFKKDAHHIGLGEFCDKPNCRYRDKANG